MYGLVGSGIGLAGHVGAPRRVRGVAENTIFAERGIALAVHVGAPRRVEASGPQGV